MTIDYVLLSIEKYCINENVISILFAGDRERDADRDRDPIFRIRERRWLDSALRDDVNLSRLDKDRTDGLLDDSKKSSKPATQNAVSFGEELHFWPEKVGGKLLWNYS